MSKRYTKGLSLLLVLGFTFSIALSGCGSSTSKDAATTQGAVSSSKVTSTADTAPAEKFQIRIMSRWSGADANAPVLKGIIDDFNQKNPNIQIVDESIADEDAFNNKLAAGVATGDIPHIFQNFNAYSFAKNEVTIDMKPYFDADKAWSDGFIGGIIDVIGGFSDLPGRYLVPMESNYEVFYYNTDLFTKAGITSAPVTYEDLKTVIKKLNAIGVTPIGAGAKDAWRLTHITNGLTAKLVGLDRCNGIRSGATKFTDPDFLSVYNVFKELVDINAFDKNMVGIDYTTENTNFFAGKSAMVYNGTWLVGEIEKSPIKDKVKTFLMPTFAGSEKNANCDVLYGGGWSLSNFVKNEKEKDAMVQVIKFLSSTDSAGKFANIGKRPPVRKDITVDPNASAILSGIVEQEKGITSGVTDVSFYSNVASMGDVFGNMTQALALKAKTPEDVVKALQAEAEKKE